MTNTPFRFQPCASPSALPSSSDRSLHLRLLPQAGRNSITKPIVKALSDTPKPQQDDACLPCPSRCTLMTQPSYDRRFTPGSLTRKREWRAGDDSQYSTSHKRSASMGNHDAGCLHVETPTTQTNSSLKSKRNLSSLSTTFHEQFVRFCSILDRPFQYWQALNTIFKEVYPDWTSYQRGRMIHHLVHFLELKIGMDEYVPTGLLLPTSVVELAWRALVMETSLYLEVIYALQDFHAKDREMIHYTFIMNQMLSPKETEDKIRRTQSLFVLYFKEAMPSSINDEPSKPLSDFPVYKREIAKPVFHFSPECADDTILELSSLSLKLDLDLLPREDNTASTQQSVCSVDESEGLMGLELLD